MNLNVAATDASRGVCGIASTRLRVVHNVVLIWNRTKPLGLPPPWFAKDTPVNDVKMAPGMASKTDIFVRDSYTSLAEIYMNQDRPAEIVPIAEEGLKRFHDSWLLYFCLAFAEYRTGNSDDALAAIKRSYELSPNSDNAYIYDRLKRGLPVE